MHIHKDILKILRMYAEIPNNLDTKVFHAGLFVHLET